jgi:RNA polymerase sigma-70 factor (ECF subfamily)
MAIQSASDLSTRSIGTTLELAAAFERYQPILVRRLTLIVGDLEEARDLAQETFLRAAKHWPVAEDVGVARWLTVVGVRLAISERRRRRRWGFLEIREGDATWALTVDPDLWRALGRLDRRTRAALVLTVLEGYTQDEVGAAMGVKRGTVASWLARGRKLLRPLLQEDLP